MSCEYQVRLYGNDPREVSSNGSCSLLHFFLSKPEDHKPFLDEAAKHGIEALFKFQSAASVLFPHSRNNFDGFYFQMIAGKPKRLKHFKFLLNPDVLDLWCQDVLGKVALDMGLHR